MKLCRIHWCALAPTAMLPDHCKNTEIKGETTNEGISVRGLAPPCAGYLL